MRGATDRGNSRHQKIRISIHAPRAGSDAPDAASPGGRRDFNPRSPCGERPVARTSGFRFLRFQSTLPVRGATRVLFWRQRNGDISIHAPRAGSDQRAENVDHVRVISIHAPRAGSDRVIIPVDGPGGDFNPRSPCGERPGVYWVIHGNIPFQSTLPVRGATTYQPALILRTTFQSTLPVRGATLGNDLDYSLRAYFNPRSPCGERQYPSGSRLTFNQFQSTLPVRGATHSTVRPAGSVRYFNPRSPCGERPGWH